MAMEVIAAVDTVAKAATGPAAPHEPAWLVYVVPLATVALVLVTIWNAFLVRRYTAATQLMVDEMDATRRAQSAAVAEMRRAREAEIRPVLVPHIEVIDPRQPQVRFGIKNVGRGPALAVDVILRWTEAMRFRLRCPVLEPGEVRLVKVIMNDIHPDVINPETIEEDERKLILTGTCEDVANVEHSINTWTPLVDRWENNISDELKEAVETEWRALRAAPPVKAPPEGA